MLIPENPRPLTCVYEVTLACNAKCLHCGSSAGDPRNNELTTSEAKELITELAGLGCRMITLSGGEPLLRSDWPELTRTILSQGMQVELITNGIEVLPQLETITKAGFRSVSLSVDGPEPIHDGLRGVPGSLRQLIRGARELVARGVKTGAVTQINKRNIDYLEDIHQLLVQEGFHGWQVQLTTPNGRAKNKNMCLSPVELPRLEAELLRFIERNEIYIIAADTIGYMSRGEPRLRANSVSKGRFFASCQAGLRLVGVTSDGTVKGCLSMSSNFNEGNIRERTFRAIWNDKNAFSYNRQFQKESLESVCGDCAFGSLCRRGCTNLAYASTGGTNHNLYCLRRVCSEQQRA